MSDKKSTVKPIISKNNLQKKLVLSGNTGAKIAPAPADVSHQQVSLNNRWFDDCIDYSVNKVKPAPFNVVVEQKDVEQKDVDASYQQVPINIRWLDDCVG